MLYFKCNGVALGGTSGQILLASQTVGQQTTLNVGVQRTIYRRTENHNCISWHGLSAAVEVGWREREKEEGGPDRNIQCRMCSVFERVHLLHSTVTPVAHRN